MRAKRTCAKTFPGTDSRVMKRVVGQGNCGTPIVHEVTADEYVPMRTDCVLP